jgi:hypothetical protein
MADRIIVRDQCEIEDQLSVATENIDRGKVQYFNETFESGMLQMYDWLVGDQDEPPLPLGGDE